MWPCRGARRRWFAFFQDAAKMSQKCWVDPWLIDFRTIKLGSRNGVTPVWRVQYNHNTVQTVVMPLCLASLKRPRWDLMGLWLCIELRWGCLLLHCCTGDLWQQSALQRCVYQPGAVHSTLGHYSKLQPWVTLCAPISTSTNDGRRSSRAM